VSRKNVEETELHYVVFKFVTRSEADSFRSMVASDYEGLCGEHEVRSGYSVLPKHQTRGGKTILNAMLPGRVYHFEDMQAMDLGYSPATVKTYLVAMAAEGVIKNIGPGTYSKPHDTTPALRPDDGLAPTIDGDLARLEQGQACGCGCGDEG
jgi:hypothetical protein